MFDGERWIFVPFRYWSVFDVGSVRVTEPLVLKDMCFLATCDFQDDNGSQVSHVNSPDCRNLANAMQSTTLRLMPSRSFCMYWMMFCRMSAMRGSLICFSPSL